MDEVVLHGAADGDGALDQREVGFLDRLGGELRAKVLERWRCTSDEDEAGRVGVDAVERACHERLVADVAHFGPSGDDAVHQRARLVAGERLYGLGRRLVECEDGIVLEEAAHADGAVRRDAVVDLLRESLHEHERAGAELLPLEGRSAVHRHHPGGARLAAERARGRREARQQSGVQTDTACFDVE